MGFALYRVSNRNDFKLNTNFLIDLYTPIIGNIATSFYILLCNNYLYSSKNRNLSFNFKATCRQINCSLEQLFDAKRKLEAFKLIDTFIFIENNVNNNLCQIIVNSPLNFFDFISNQKYKTLLIDKIGIENYQYLEYKYLPSTLSKDLLNVSETFDNVFCGEKMKKTNIIDFEKIYKDLFKLSTRNILISNECKTIIENVYLKFPLSLNEIENVILNSLDNVSDKNIFLCNPKFLICNFNKIIMNSSHLNLNQNISKYISINVSRSFNLFSSTISDLDSQKIINDYKLINSEQYLYSIFKKNISIFDRNIIGILKEEYSLKDEVINVIIDFSLYKTNGKLNKKYILKIAQTFNGLNINSCELAIQHFRKNISLNSIDNVSEINGLKLEHI